MSRKKIDTLKISVIILPSMEEEQVMKDLDIVSERLKNSELFTYYGNLLNKVSKDLMLNYIDEDLSISEIANLYGISRQAVHDKIKRNLLKLDNYERELNLISNSKIIQTKLDEIKYELKRLNIDNDSRIYTLLDEISERL